MDSLQVLAIFIVGGIYTIMVYTLGYAAGKDAGYDQSLAHEYRALDDDEDEDDYPCDDCLYNTDLVKEDVEDGLRQGTDKETTTA